MNCREAHDLLAGLALGELDRELEAAVRAHAEGCGPCRAAAGALKGAAAELAAAAPRPSAERRARAAEAMGRAYEENVLADVRRPGTPWRARAGLAAAALVAFSLGVVVAPRERARADALTVTRVVGRAFVQRPFETRWQEVRAGDILREGDRLSGPVDALLPGGATLAGYEGSEVTVASAVPLRLALGAGRILCRTDRPLTVTGPDGAELACDQGWFEASLQPLPARPTRGSITLEEAAELVAKRTKKKIAVDPGLRDEEVMIDFDPDRYGEQMIKGLEQALPPGIHLFPAPDGSLAVLPEQVERDPGEQTLRVRVREGRVRLTGTQGAATVAAGKESRVTGRGLPLAARPAPLPGDAGRARRSWSREVSLDEREGLVRFGGLRGVLQQADRRYWFSVADADVRLDLQADRSVASLPVTIEYGRLP